MCRGLRRQKMSGVMSLEIHDKKLELCPPPSISEAVPPTARVLEALLAERGEQVDLLFSLGCVYLRRGDSSAGIGAFTRALKLDSENAALLCNLAVGYMQEKRWDEASAALKRAILLSPELELAFFHLATTELAREDVAAARAAYESAIAVEGSSERPCYLLAELLQEQGIKDEARSWYEEAFRRGERCPSLINRLGAFAFDDGLRRYEAGEFQEAMRIWGAAYRDYERAFVANQDVSSRLNALVRIYNEENQLEQFRETMRVAEIKKSMEQSYQFALRIFFSLGRMPELYVEQENIAEEFSRWEREIEKAEDAIIPFAHYRIGILHIYCGAFEEAIEKLSFARDHVPPSKHRPLRIEPTLRFVKDFLGKDDEELAAGREYSKAEWEASGFGDPFQHQAWSSTGISPRDALSWKEAGFSPKAAARWHGSDLEPSVARAWSDAGFSDADKVRRWMRGGFDIASAQLWQVLFDHRLELAVQCRQAGFSSPEEASSWLEIFTFPWEAEAWKVQGFTPEQAQKYLLEGIKDPFIAKQTRELAAEEEN